MASLSNPRGRTSRLSEGATVAADGLELLRHDVEFNLYRLREAPAAETRLMKVLVAERPSAEAIAQLHHEHALRDTLNPAWAVLPLELSRWEGHAALLLADPGGIPLDSLVGFPMELTRFLHLAIAVTAAVARMHEHGIVHKDIKPANVLVDQRSNAVHLMGFSAATHLPREHQPLAPLENIAGTLAYMAPEQTGRINRSIDSRSDLYALGVSLYQMLTGVLPFDAIEPMELFHCHMARQAIAPAERLPGVPRLLSAIVMKLLAKAAEDRYQMASGLEADLRHCLEQWQAFGRIDDFPLCTLDLSAQLLIPEKLYGREAEISLLNSAFYRVAALGTTELVMVSGYSGIGKSSLVNELHKVLFPRRGLFAAGKFEQYKRDIPYATLAQALRGLVRQILGQNETQVREWREALMAALGPNAALVVRLVPELEFIIGTPPLVQDIPLNEAHNRFQATLGRFIGVFAQPRHPLVLFLDDLQWLDTATLQLLEHMLNEPGLHHLLLIGAYRDNEVSSFHPLMRMLRVIRYVNAVPVHAIVLSPLGLDDVNRFLADALHCTSTQAQGLAELVHKRTGGNPFFMIQFLTMLAEERLLTMAPDKAGWAWDLTSIRAKSLTDNVVDLMVGKLNRLPAAAQDVLKLLGCLGNSAATGLLSEMRGVPEEEIHAGLWEAVRTGLVFRSDGAYTFLHDRIQQAAYSLIPPDERAQEHLRVGRLLASRTAPEEIEEKIFEIVNQFDHAAGLITSEGERLQVAEFNLIAGRRAKDSTACGAALKYLSTGSALLPEDRWERHYGLSFALEFQRADCEYLTGDLRVAEERLSMLSLHVADDADLAAVTCARINLFTTLGQSDRAVEAGLDYLRRVGIEWSPHPTEGDVRQEFGRIWQQLGDRAIEELVDLPLMQGSTSRATMDVLMTMLPPTLFTDENLPGMVVGRMANTSLEYGHSNGSCIGYAWLGTVLGPRFGNYQAGYRFGKLGLDLVDKRGLDRYKARVYVHFGNVVTPWTHPFHTGAAWVRHAFDVAKENGDLTFAAYSCNHLITNLLASGAPLADIEREAGIGLEFVRKARFGLVVDIITTQIQLVRMLQGATHSFSSFDSEGFTENEFEQHLEEDPRLAIAACWYWIRKLQARFIAGDHQAAVKAEERAQRLLWTSPSHVEIAEFHFFGALARAARCDGAHADERIQHLDALAGHARHLNEWALHCPSNFENRAALVSAEIARLDGQDVKAMRLYERSIQSARDNGFVHNQGLAHELAAEFFLACGAATAARAHLSEAFDCYSRWGADGKIGQLEARHAQLQPRPRGELDTPLGQIDIQTVTKASQAISGQIVLDELVDTLMRIMLKNAGAQCGYLLLSRGNGLTLAAEASVDPQQTVQVVLHLGEALPQPHLPQSLLNFVRRSQVPVVLADAAQAHLYSTDPCWEKRRAKSVLCLPILRQSTLLGVLYLENNLVTHAFLAQQLTVLELLAAQAAISLENAMLYADLRRENFMRQQVETTLRERETRFRRLVEANIIGVFFWNISGEVSEANDAFLGMLGYHREDVIAGKVDWAAITPVEYLAADQHAKVELQHFGKCTPYEKEYIRKDGRRIPVLIGGAFLEGSQEQGLAYVLDLSERKQAEAERDARRVAEAANVAKSSFLASMSHEIRTPLNGILGFAQILQRDMGLSEKQARGLKIIDESGRHLLTLINDILDLARIDAAKLELYATPVNLASFLQGVCDIVRVKADEKGLLFVYQGAADLPDTVRVDEKRLRQVLLNLLSNAVKFTDSGHVTLQTTRLLRSTSESIARLRFEVEDSGIGMSEAQLGRLFTPFEQVAEVNRRDGGTGLGLAISRQLIRLMGGDIDVRSQPHRGSVFSFEIDMPVLSIGVPAHAVSRVPLGYEGPCKKIVIVDDVPQNRTMLIDLLAPLGFSLAGAGNGKEALDLIARLRPDLVVTDLMMPVMDGFELIRCLRASVDTAKLPIIAASASATIEMEARSRLAGASAFIAKPIDQVVLLDAIANTLQLKWGFDKPVPSISDANGVAKADLVIPPAQ